MNKITLYSVNHHCIQLTESYADDREMANQFIVNKSFENKRLFTNMIMLFANIKILPWF